MHATTEQDATRRGTRKRGSEKGGGGEGGAGQRRTEKGGRVQQGARQRGEGGTATARARCPRRRTRGRPLILAGGAPGGTTERTTPHNPLEEVARQGRTPRERGEGGTIKGCGERGGGDCLLRAVGGENTREDGKGDQMKGDTPIRGCDPGGGAAARSAPGNGRRAEAAAPQCSTPRG